MSAGDQALLSAVDAHLGIQPPDRLAHLLGGTLLLTPSHRAAAGQALVGGLRAQDLLLDAVF
ncbi:hypothetical protein, partial [Cronobacter sakazakii]|uniref:hypothetical protein n=1 Tax=Cronobacter sakazakii TaxID=28141 RepID=UPI001F2B6A0C